MPRPTEFRKEVLLICSHQQPRHSLDEDFHMYDVDCGISLPEMNELLRTSPKVNERLIKLAKANLKALNTIDTEMTTAGYRTLLRKLKKLQLCTEGIVTSPSSAQGNGYAAFDYVFQGRPCNVKTAESCSHLDRAHNPPTITTCDMVISRGRLHETLDLLRNKSWPGDTTKKIERMKQMITVVVSSDLGSPERTLAAHQFDDALSSEKWQSKYRRRAVYES